MSKDKQIKLDKDGVRLCDQEGCEFIATHTFIWAQQGWTCQCAIHLRGMLNIERQLGGNIAHNSARPMTSDEMMPDTQH